MNILPANQTPVQVPTTCVYCDAVIPSDHLTCAICVYPENRPDNCDLSQPGPRFWSVV
jgi:hypothetical protein